MIIKAKKLDWTRYASNAYLGSAPDDTTYIVYQLTVGWCWHKQYESETSILVETEEAAKSAAQDHWNERCISFLDQERLEKITLAYHDHADHNRCTGGCVGC